MIRLHVTTKDFDLNDKVTEYVERKIGGLDRYLPRRARDIEGQVILERDRSAREGNEFICEAKLEIPGPNAEAREATVNIYAAIDIVEAKLKVQIKKFKDKHQPGRLRRSKALVRRLLGSAPSDIDT